MKAGPESSEPGPSATWLVTTAHNRTQHPLTMPVLQGSPSLQVWSKASTVRVSLGHASWAKGPPDRITALRDAETPDVGTLDNAATDSVKVDRARIGHLSKGSRARLMQKLATIDANALGLLVTLTWPTWAAPDREQWHKAWDRWRMRLARSWPEAAGLWRREYTRAGVVHIHLLMFPNVAIDRAIVRSLQDWTAKAWADVVDAPEYDKRLGAGSSVEVIRSARAVQRYAAKYVAKTADGDGTERPMGRWWGTFGGASAIPYTLPDDYQLTEAEGHAIRRTMERWLQAKRRHRATVTGRRIKGRAPRPRASRRIFTDNPSQWLRVLDLLRQPSQVTAESRAVSAAGDA